MSLFAQGIRNIGGTWNDSRDLQHRDDADEIRIIQAPSDRRLNVAIADDDPTVRRTFELLIRAIGQTVSCAAADGSELIRKCMEVKVDLAFVDLHMPVMDGLEAAEILTTLAIPVVLISGDPDAREIVFGE